MLQELDQICEDVEKEWGASGLTDGFYDEYAKDVARKYALAILRSLDKPVIEDIQKLIEMLTTHVT